MKVPACGRVRIDPTKVRDYLLCRDHPVGRFKAVFFEALGYSAANWQALESDLRQLAAAGDAALGEQTRYGQKYEVRGTLPRTSDRTADVVTIWIVRSGEETPRFVTAFPGGK